MIVNFTPITTIRKPALAVAGLLALAGCVPPHFWRSSFRFSRRRH